MHADNKPQWNGRRQGFYEVWYYKLNHLDANNSLWLRFTTLSRKDGSKEVAEVWAIYTHSNGQKQAFKSTFPASKFCSEKPGLVQIENSNFDEGSTKGSVGEISWDLKFKSNDFTFHHVPSILGSLGLAKSKVCKPNIDIHFNGEFRVKDKVFRFNNAPGCQGHIWGSRYALDWAWAHCNSFQDSNGEDVIFDMLSARVLLGGIIPSPQMSALYVKARNQVWEFHSLKDALSIKSFYSPSSWCLGAQKGSTKFTIEIEARPELMAGVKYEATDGQILYCHNTAFAHTRLAVFEGKQMIFEAKSQVASYEFVKREQNPLVEFVL